jgi:serine/threonine protein phosphatase PrpC
MKLLDQLSYRSNGFWRPQAGIIEEKDIGFWGVCFSWGELDLAGKVLENVRFFVDAYVNQSEITNPFGYDPALSGLENALRSGCALANDVIYRQVNKVALSGGVECALMVRQGRELAILQVGQPHIFLLRQGKVLPVLAAFDFLSSDPRSGAFLPSQLLGLNASCYPHFRSLHIEQGDEILLLAHSQIPGGVVWSGQDLFSSDLKPLFQKISRASPRTPFWLSKIRL